MVTGSELRILRLLFSNNRISPFTGMDVVSIERESTIQAESFNLKNSSNMKGLSLPTIRRCLKSLNAKNLVEEGIKKEVYKKTYYITSEGLEFMNSVISASTELMELENKNKTNK